MDLFQVQLSNVPQYVWHNLGYIFDVIGPYFTPSKSFKQAYLIACVFEIMRACYAYEFSATCLVCDGASTNLNVIKALIGVSGSFGSHVLNGKTDHSIQPSFPNPFDNGRLCYCIICPSHQMKNIIISFAFQPSNRSKELLLVRSFIWVTANRRFKKARR